MASERETALRQLQEGELVLCLLGDRFQASRSRYDDAYDSVSKLKETLQREGVDTLGTRMSPELSPVFIGNAGSRDGELSFMPSSPAQSIGSRASSESFSGATG